LLTFSLCIWIVTTSGWKDVQYKQAFKQFIQNYKRSYTSDEYQTRFKIFKANMDFINDWNTKGLHRVGINKFADLTREERLKFFHGLKISDKSLTNSRNEKVTKTILKDLPDSLDWRDKGAVTDIKDQGNCGSCWSFSTTGSIEGCHQISTGELVSLSEQNLIDCSWLYGNQGCDGGFVDSAFQYVIDNKGIDTEDSYPYMKRPTNCAFNKTSVGATLINFTKVIQCDEGDLQRNVNLGPTSVSINANLDSFHFYTSGIYSDSQCGQWAIDHAVLTVGWGKSDTGEEYWIVKNSWGLEWGMKGYIFIKRNAGNMCGMATLAFRAVCDKTI